MSLLQFRAQPQGFAEGLAHPPFGPLSTPRCPGQLNELPRRALLLDLRQYLAAPFVGELAGNMWLHVTHLLSAELMDGSARREDPHLAQAVRPAVPLLMIKIRYGSPVDPTTAWLARMVASADAVSIRRLSPRAAGLTPARRLPERRRGRGGPARLRWPKSGFCASGIACRRRC